MKIAKNVDMLEIKSERGTLYPVLIFSDKSNRCPSGGSEKRRLLA